MLLFETLEAMYFSREITRSIREERKEKMRSRHGRN